MSAPRLEVDLAKIEANTRALVGRLAPAGIRVTGVTKAVLGSPEVGAAMLRGGAVGLGDSRIPNLARLVELDGADGGGSRTLIRSPMLSQVEQIVRTARCSLNTESVVLAALDAAAARAGVRHDVVLMVEVGDLREGIAVEDVPAAVGVVLGCRSLRLAGLGANLACQNGVVPDAANMGVLSDLVNAIESSHRLVLDTVSGGNSANLGWVASGSEVGRVNDLRLGESILLGVDPLHRAPIDGLATDAFTLFGEVIERIDKPFQPWGSQAQGAFGEVPPRVGRGTVRQGILALGRQDVDPDTLVPPAGITVLGTSSDHLVLDLGDHPAVVGDEIAFGVGYAALVRAATSPFVVTVGSDCYARPRSGCSSRR